MRIQKRICCFVGFSLLLCLCFAQTPLLADGEEDFAEFIAALEKLPKKEFTNILIEEVRDYLYRYPEAKDADKMHMKIATIYSNKGDELRSFLTHMEILYLYPHSDVVTTAKDRLRSLIIREKKFRPLKERIDTLLNPTASDSTLEEATYAFIRDLYDLNFQPVAGLLTETCDRFLEHYPKSAHAESVLYWKAQLLARDKRPRKALAAFMKLTYLFKNGLYVTASKLKMAELFTEKLDMHQNAILTLEEFLLEHPDDPQAPQAQFRMAQILEKKKKTYLEAINAYTAVAERYPKSLEAVPALFDAARLYEEKFKEYDQAIRVYSQIVRDFPDDLKAPLALAEAARIYEKRLKDELNAANTYFKIYGSYPKSDIAAQSLFAAAEINEKKLNDPEKALMYYRMVVDEYPESKVASKASKRIEKLTKELGQE